MQERTILNREFVLQDQIKGFEAYDYEYAAQDGKASPETVFELINASVSAAEAETAANDGVPSLQHAPLSWGAKRVAEFCNDYDDFINSPDFQMDVFGVLKLNMENFWAALERNKQKRARYGEDNSARVLNKVETDGGSSVYQFGNNKVTFGYLANNMTYDGQYAYVLTSERAGGAARRCFKTTGNYPKELDVISGKRTRWGQITAKIAAAGETAIGAWAVLESEDARYFYGELKKHNWLNASDKQLLKSVKRAAGGMTFDLYKEALEIRADEIEDVLPLFDELRNAKAEAVEIRRKYDASGSSEARKMQAELEGAYAYVDDLETRIYNVVESETDAELELEQIEDKLLSYDEEHNSEAAISVFEDYDNFNYYKEKYYYENRPKASGQ